MIAIFAEMIDHCQVQRRGTAHATARSGSRADAAQKNHQHGAHRGQENPELLQTLLNTLLVRLADANQTVRLLLLQGFGNLSSNGPEEVNRYSTTILSALMSGMDDINGAPDLVLAAMDSLSRVLAIVDSSNVLSMLVNICMKLKGYFDTVRAAATPPVAAVRRTGGNSRLRLHPPLVRGCRPTTASARAPSGSSARCTGSATGRASRSCTTSCRPTWSA